MKIELKNTDFKYLVEFLDEFVINEGVIKRNDDDPFLRVFLELKSQYDKAFTKYQDEKQEFKHGELVKFKTAGGIWRDARSGVIHKIFRKRNGQYKYMIKYIGKEIVYEEDYEEGEYSEEKEVDVERYTNPLTKKNIKKMSE